MSAQSLLCAPSCSCSLDRLSFADRTVSTCWAIGKLLPGGASSLLLLLLHLLYASDRDCGSRKLKAHVQAIGELLLPGTGEYEDSYLVRLGEYRENTRVVSELAMAGLAAPQVAPTLAFAATC